MGLSWDCFGPSGKPIRLPIKGLSGGIAILGSGIAHTRSPRLCQAMVPPDSTMVSPSVNVRLTGDGTANTPKTRDETVLAPNLNLFGAYKYPTHPCSVNT